MCPDMELISAYHDGELNSETELKIKKHLAECRNCSQKWKSIANISTLLHDPVCFDLSHAQIKMSMQSVKKRILYHKEINQNLSFWYRYVSVPFPVLAGMAASLIIFIGIWFIVLGNSATTHDHSDQMMPGQFISRSFIFELNDDIQPHSTFSQIYQQMYAQNEAVTMQLPENSKFMVVGEPQFMRAADYRRE